MHIQIINYSIKDLSEAELNTLCDQLAPAIADMPGLVSKVWLADPATNTYGGVYTWRDKQSMKNFMESSLVADFVSNPHITDVVSKDFAVAEGPTRVTRGLVEEAA